MALDKSKVMEGLKDLRFIYPADKLSQDYMLQVQFPSQYFPKSIVGIPEGDQVDSTGLDTLLIVIRRIISQLPLEFRDAKDEAVRRREQANPLLRLAMADFVSTDKDILQAARYHALKAFYGGQRDASYRPTGSYSAGGHRGVGASLVHRGGLWSALGLWQEKVQMGVKALDAFVTNGAFRMLFPTPWLKLNPAGMFNVQVIVKNLEEYFKIPPFLDGEELGATELTDEEVIFIEHELLSTYRYNLVALPSEKQSRPFDIASLLDVGVDKTNILDVEKAWEDYKEKGCVAIYTGLTVKGKEYLAQDVTLLCNSLLDDVRKYTGMG
ncbi:hypothetical protein GL218_06430 [Daldinia childiae]|uniref:uncharacterized protein n=1 Tax=Daldinia childiae TaxID=326645 RepID=UPI001446FD0A|nr:uncharacterized protein GL218_06430 [Daldinia childiae]KAF3056453.1 hypothetical protein GL218_06430 [Daldinia childiae]